MDDIGVATFYGLSARGAENAEPHGALPVQTRGMPFNYTWSLCQDHESLIRA